VSLALAQPLRPAARPELAHSFLNVYLAGVGAVGGALLDQIEAIADPRLRLVGVCTTRGSVLDPQGIAPEDARAAVGNGRPREWQTVFGTLPSPTVFVDATGSLEVAGFYERLFDGGHHVATPSKLANTRAQERFEGLLRLASDRGVHYRYEATVGAGLPVIRVVQDLLATGDRLRSAQGVVSGTMTYLFSRVEAGVPLSLAVREAVRQGYAEPDPRDDLSGEDVVRKLLILARTAGYRIEREEVEVESLVPQELAAVTRDEFLRGLEAYDRVWARRTAEARSRGERLRYVGRLREGSIRIGVESVPAASPLGLLRGTDNLLELTTDRYATSPLTVQGPGAGPAVTAGGVLADVLDIAARVTAR
jgi:homoserine dehydrogenase